MDHSVPCWLISAYELYLIGKRQAHGSQKAVFMLAKAGQVALRQG